MYNKLLSQWFQVVCALRQRLDRSSDGSEGSRADDLARRRERRYEDVRAVVVRNRFDETSRCGDSGLRVREGMDEPRRQTVHQTVGAKKYWIIFLTREGGCSHGQ